MLRAAFPPKRRAEFHRLGVDTEGGYHDTTACTNTTTNLVLESESYRIHAQSGHQVFIEGDPFVLEPNLDICAATNAREVSCRRRYGRARGDRPRAFRYL